MGGSLIFSPMPLLVTVSSVKIGKSFSFAVNGGKSVGNSVVVVVTIIGGGDGGPVVVTIDGCDGGRRSPKLLTFELATRLNALG